VLRPGDATPRSPSPIPPGPRIVVEEKALSVDEEAADGDGDGDEDEEGGDHRGGRVLRGRVKKLNVRKERRRSSRKRSRKKSKRKSRRRQVYDLELPADDTSTVSTTSSDHLTNSPASNADLSGSASPVAAPSRVQRRSAERKGRPKRRRDDRDDAQWADGAVHGETVGGRARKKRKLPLDTSQIPPLPPLNGWLKAIPKIQPLPHTVPPSTVRAVTFESMKSRKEMLTKQLRNGAVRGNPNEQFLAKEVTKSKGDHYRASSHLTALIAQQSQLDLHAQRCLVYQQFKRYVQIAQCRDVAELVPSNEAELTRLQMLRTMQLQQQLEFQKTKENDTMIIGKQHGVVGSKQHMDCIPLSPTIPSGVDQMRFLIENVAPRRTYYLPSMMAIRLDDVGFAKTAMAEKQREQAVRRERLRHQQMELERSRRAQKQIAMHQQQIRLRQQQWKRQQEAVRKMQNVIDVIVQNKATLCGAPIRDSQHAVQHLSNCKACISMLEKCRDSLFGTG